MSKQSEKKKKGGFFVVDAKRLSAACMRSMNDGLAYLVLASGTGPDNRTTTWSTTSLRKRAGIGVDQARSAIGRLVVAGDIALAPDSSPTHPTYVFAELGEELLWLPRSIVETTAKGPKPLLIRLRETGSRAVLGAFVELCRLQNLASHHGVPRAHFEFQYSRLKVGEFDQFNLFAFGGSRELEMSEELVGRLNEYSEDDSVNPGETLLRLFDVGAVEWATYLWEGAETESEAIVPCRIKSGSVLDKQQHAMSVDAVMNIAFACIEEVLPEPMQKKLHKARSDGYFVAYPVPRHRVGVCMTTILRLTHRPRTKNAAYFAARDKEMLENAEHDLKAFLKQFHKKSESANIGV